jgi:hypothetical protein
MLYISVSVAKLAIFIGISIDYKYVFNHTNEK